MSAEIGSRKPRSDALQNRERLIAAAKDVLGQGGPAASLGAVARRADVGIGTLYRHFPTRENLFQAVYAHEVADLVRLAEDLRDDSDSIRALRTWMHAYVALVATKRGLLGALAVVPTDASKALYADLSGRLSVAVDGLLALGRSTGTLRSDVRADDLLLTMSAICYARPPEPGWEVQVRRLLDIFADGMRRT